MADASAKETAALSKKEMKDFSSTVQKGLKAYTELPPKLLKRIGQFLIDGQDETCLLEMDAAYSKQGRKQFFNESYGQVTPKDRVEGKRMSALLTLEKVSPGYYRRLGEIASRIPEMARLNLKPNALLPDWFNRLMLLWSVLKRDNVRSYRH